MSPTMDAEEPEEFEHDDPEDLEESEDDEDDEDDDEEEGHPEPEVTIEVSGLSLYTHMGVTAAEREIGQRLLVDLRLDVGECDATVTDRIEDTVDYGEVCELVNLVAQQREYRTLERFCAAVADRLIERYEIHVRLGQGRQARAADRAHRRRGLGRGLARGVNRRGYLGLGSEHRRPSRAPAGRGGRAAAPRRDGACARRRPMTPSRSG